MKFVFQLWLTTFWACCLVTLMLFNNRPVLAQLGGSSINGMVFDSSKNGLTDVDVELLDEFSRLISRTRTSGGGRFSFTGLVAGNYVVRVMPGRLGYKEQSQEVQLVSIPRGQNARPTNDIAYVDFTLQLNRAVSFTEAVGINSSIFVQDVPSKAAALYEKAMIDFNQKNNDSGLRNLTLAIEAFPNYFLALNRLAEEYILLKNFKSAKEVLEKAVKVNPKAPDTLYMLGYCQYVLKEFDAAIKSLQESSVWNSKAAATCLLLGMSYKQTKNFTEAETQMLKAKKLSKKKFPEIHWQLALLYGNNLKRYNDAAIELELFLKDQPDSKDSESIKKLIKQFREKALQSS